MTNNLKTVALLAALTALLLWIGHHFGGNGGLVMALLFAGLMNFVTWFFSDRIVLAMHGAREVSSAEEPTLHAVVEELAYEASIPKPRVYIIPAPQPNAFATGRSPRHAAVAVTEGLLRMMDREELKGVIAHELTHIKNRDTLIMVVAATIAGAISMLAYWLRWGLFLFGLGGRDENRGGLAELVGLLLVTILAPILAVLIQLAISRAREYAADEGAARLCRSPEGLISALQKIEMAVRRGIPLPQAQPTTSHLFIANPFGGAGIAKLFMTHPPVEERIRRLREIWYGKDVPLVL